MILRALIVITSAIALLFTVASHARAKDMSIFPTNKLGEKIDIAKDNNPFSGATSITLSMSRDETCRASQYGVGDKYNGKRTASGAIFNTWARSPYTVAHRTRAFGSMVTVTNLRNGRSIRAVVNDRGPYVRGRCVDLGRAGADAIGMGGTAPVSVQ